jgi:hypothetical protein
MEILFRLYSFSKHSSEPPKFLKMTFYVMFFSSLYEILDPKYMNLTNTVSLITVLLLVVVCGLNVTTLYLSGKVSISNRFVVLCELYNALCI